MTVTKQKNKIHIVYIVTKLELGGAQKVCLDLFKGLSKRTTTTSLISGAQGTLVPETKKFDSVFLLPSFKREIRLKNIFSEIKNFFTIIKILRKLKKQHATIIVHTHSTKAGFIGRWAAFFTGIPYRIHTIHGYGFHDYQSRIAWLATYLPELITSLITTHFVCVSDKDRQTGMRFFPRFAQKSSVIRAAADWKKFSQASKTKTILPARKATEPFIIGTVSCFKPQKNLFDLLQAFRTTQNTITNAGYPSPNLQIIGDGVLRNKIELWIKQEKLDQVITLLGWQENIVPWMKTWNLFALSSLWEGLPIAIVEARLLKLPVLSYKIGGIPEVIFDGKNGFLEAPKNWMGLAKKMTKIIKNHKLHKSISMYDDQLDDFNNNIMVKKHLSLYKTFFN